MDAGGSFPGPGWLVMVTLRGSRHEMIGATHANDSPCSLHGLAWWCAHSCSRDSPQGWQL